MPILLFFLGLIMNYLKINIFLSFIFFVTSCGVLNKETSTPSNVTGRVRLKYKLYDRFREEYRRAIFDSKEECIRLMPSSSFPSGRFECVSFFIEEAEDTSAEDKKHQIYDHMWEELFGEYNSLEECIDHITYNHYDPERYECLAIEDSKN